MIRKKNEKLEFLDSLKKGNKIQIKKSHQGKFTEYCDGKVTSECIAKGKNSSNPKIRKLAIFTENARKWKHTNGGLINKYFPGGAVFKAVTNFFNSDAGKAITSTTLNTVTDNTEDPNKEIKGLEGITNAELIQGINDTVNIAFDASKELAKKNLENREKRKQDLLNSINTQAGKPVQESILPLPSTLLPNNSAQDIADYYNKLAIYNQLKSLETLISPYELDAALKENELLPILDLKNEIKGKSILKGNTEAEQKVYDLAQEKARLLSLVNLNGMQVMAPIMEEGEEEEIVSDPKIIELARLKKLAEEQRKALQQISLFSGGKLKRLQLFGNYLKHKEYAR